jgi:hypothetical protein
MTACRYIISGQSNFDFEYLGEFEKVLGFKPGAQGGFD